MHNVLFSDRYPAGCDNDICLFSGFSNPRRSFLWLVSCPPFPDYLCPKSSQPGRHCIQISIIDFSWFPFLTRKDKFISRRKHRCPYPAKNPHLFPAKACQCPQFYCPELCPLFQYLCPCPVILSGKTIIFVGSDFPVNLHFLLAIICILLPDDTILMAVPFSTRMPLT